MLLRQQQAMLHIERYVEVVVFSRSIYVASDTGWYV